MKKIYIQSQTPRVIIPVSCTDVSGAEFTMRVEFKRELQNTPERVARLDEAAKFAMLSEDTKQFLSEEVLGFYDFTLIAEDEVSGEFIPKTFTSHKAPEFLEFMELDTPEDGFQALFSLYSGSQVWIAALYNAILNIAVNLPAKEIETKN